MKMHIYSVNYWVSFPSSEYGGLFVVLAENDAAAIELLSGYGNDPDGSSDDENEAIAHAVRTADKFTAETDRAAGVIAAFIT
jgi:hypothetical protein